MTEKIGGSRHATVKRSARVEGSKDWEKSPKADDKALPKKPDQTLVSKQTSFSAGSGTKQLAKKKTEVGGVEIDSFANGPSFNIDGQASAKLGTGGLDIDLNLKIDANLIEAGASANKTIRFKFQGEEFAVNVKLDANGKVGANGELKIKLQVGPNGFQAKLDAEGFAGAKGSLSGSIDVSANGKELASGAASVTFAAGVMAGASLEAGLDHFHAKAYAAVGVGVGFDISGQVNTRNAMALLPKLVEPEDLAKNAADLGKMATTLGQNVGQAVSGFWHKISPWG